MLISQILKVDGNELVSMIIKSIQLKYDIIY